MSDICQCGHGYDRHTYSHHRTGCDECGCNANIVNMQRNELAKLRAENEALKSEIEGRIKDETDMAVEIHELVWALKKIRAKEDAQVLQGAAWSMCEIAKEALKEHDDER